MKSLDIYVFDDSDPEDAAYLGVANIPLLPLTHDTAIKGAFELKGVRLYTMIGSRLNQSCCILL